MGQIQFSALSGVPKGKTVHSCQKFKNIKKKFSSEEKSPFIVD